MGIEVAFIWCFLGRAWFGLHCDGYGYQTSTIDTQ
jgi:hypothetical protein